MSLANTGGQCVLAARGPGLETATCPVCGREFIQGLRRKVCSPMCAEKKRRARAINGPDPRPLVACYVCGAPVPRGRSKCCSRACTVRAADRRRHGRPVADAGRSVAHPKTTAPVDVERRAVWDPAPFVAWRKRLGLSQVKAAAVVGVDERTVVRWETLVTTPTEDMRRVVEAVMRVPVGTAAAPSALGALGRLIIERALSQERAR